MKIFTTHHLLCRKFADVLCRNFICQKLEISARLLPKGLRGLNPPNCFLNPPNTLPNYILGGSATYHIHTIYITILVALQPSKIWTSQLIFYNSNIDYDPGSRAAGYCHYWGAEIKTSTESEQWEWDIFSQTDRAVWEKVSQAPQGNPQRGSPAENKFWCILSSTNTSDK